MDFTKDSLKVVNTSSLAGEVEQRASATGFQIWHIRLSSEIRSKDSLLDVIGERLSFPDYFGRNWDSLEECLRDLSINKGGLIIFEQSDQLLALPERDLATFGEIVLAVGKHWRSAGKFFGALFIGSAKLNDALGLSHDLSAQPL